METFSVSTGFVLNCLVITLGVLVLILAFGASKQAQQIAEVNRRLRLLEPSGKASAAGEVAPAEDQSAPEQNRAFKTRAA